MTANAEATGVEKCECGHIRSDHSAKTFGCAFCPCSEYEARTLPNAEATGAREALKRLLWIVERHIAGHIVRSVGATHEPVDNEDRQYNDLMQLIVDVEEIVEEPSAPAPRKVRATVQCEFGRWELHHDAWMFVDHYGDPQDGGPMSRIEVGFMAERQSRADAEGFVEESQERLVTVAPSPSASGETEDSPSPPVAPTPSASPEAGQSPSRAAQDTADGRVWWMIRHPQTSYGYVWDSEHEAWLGSGEAQRPTPVVPRSELARVQRERDEARASRDDWEEIAWGRAKEIASVSAQLATAEQKLSAALDRVRVAEQRIETGEVRWRSNSGTLWSSRPFNRDIAEYGPFTRGRFVADTENKA